MKNINFFYRNLYRVLTKWYGRKFRMLGRNTCLFQPMQINNPRGISIGDDVFIAHNAWLMGAVNIEAVGLVIQERTTIGHFAHIVALNSVVIENDVLIADRVFISDSTHTYDVLDVPIKNQPVKFLQPVVIGTESWIGENVCILGVSIGKHCIVASNSVVTKDIPDYCVVAGVPAKVIKKYDFKTKKWEKM